MDITVKWDCVTDPAHDPRPHPTIAVKTMPDTMDTMEVVSTQQSLLLYKKTDIEWEINNLRPWLLSHKKFLNSLLTKN